MRLGRLERVREEYPRKHRFGDMLDASVNKGDKAS